MEWIKKAWRGEVQLWKAFWLYGLVGGIAVNLVFATVIAMGFGAYSLSQVVTSIATVVQSNLIGMKLGLTYALAVIPALYSAWVSLVVWKSAFNVSVPVWGYLARMLVVLSLACIVVNLHAIMDMGDKIVKGAGASAGTGLFSECEEEMTRLALVAKMSVQEYKNRNIEQYSRCTCRLQFDNALKSRKTPPPSHVLSVDECINSALSQMPELRKYQERRAREAAAAAVDAAASQLCEKTMADIARKAGSDPQQYVADNQAYFQQCVKYYHDNPTAVKK